MPGRAPVRALCPAAGPGERTKGGYSLSTPIRARRLTAHGAEVLEDYEFGIILAKREGGPARRVSGRHAPRDSRRGDHWAVGMRGGAATAADRRRARTAAAEGFRLPGQRP